MKQIKKTLIPYDKDTEEYHRKLGERFYTYRSKKVHSIEPTWAEAKDEGNVWAFYNERK